LKILVPIKYTIDTSQLKFDSSTKEPLVEACPKGMGDCDKRAVEEAVRIKEKLGAKVVVASIIKDKSALRVIRDAYAMGVDEGYAIYHENAELLDSITIAKILSKLAIATGPYDLIITGIASSDTHSATLGPALASFLDIPVIVGADNLELASNGKVVARCMMEDGTYTFEVKPPVLVTVTTEINEPRIPTLKDILKSKRVPINEVRVEDLGVELPRPPLEVLEVKRYEVPRKRTIIDATDLSKIDENIDLLVKILKDEGVI